jgi:hypothetical protein
MIQLDRDDRRVIVLLARAEEMGARVTVPATASPMRMSWCVRAGVASPSLRAIRPTFDDSTRRPT